MPRPKSITLSSSQQVFALMAVSLCVAVFLTYLVNPFLTTADGALRWRYALHLLNGGAFRNVYLFPPLGSLLMAGVYYLTGSFSVYTILQSFVMLFSGGCLLMRLGQPNVTGNLPLFAALVFILFPTVSIFSVVLTDSAFTFAAIAWSLCLLLPSSTHPPPSTSRQLWIVLQLLAAFILLFGLRHNTVTLLPVIVILLWRRFSSRGWRVAAFGSLFAALFLVKITVPQALDLKARYPASLGMAWEMVGIYSVTTDPDIKEVLQRFGDPEAMASRYFPTHSNELIWDAKPPMPAKLISQPRLYHQIKSAYFEVIRNDPMRFIRFKVQQWGLTLGITEPLLEAARGIHESDMNSLPFGAQVNNGQNRWLNLFVDTTQWFGIITLRPIVILTIAGGLIVVLCRAGSNSISALGATYAVAVFYYAGFLVQTQAMEFRYFAPSFFLSLIVALAAISEILGRYLGDRCRSRAAAGGTGFRVLAQNSAVESS